MRKIHKGPEPESLRLHRERQPTTEEADPPCYGNYTQLDDARAAARLEQREICAFCQATIARKKAGMRLAHIIPRSDPNDGARLQLVWTNIVGSCRGGEGTKEPKDYHCDKRQGPIPLHQALDPVHLLPGALTFDATAAILAADGNPDVQDQLDDVLGLNLEHIKERRRRAWQDTRGEISAEQDPAKKRAQLLETLDSANIRIEPLLEYSDYLLHCLRQWSPGS